MSILSNIADFVSVISGKAERGYLKSIGQANADECLYFEKLGKEKREKEALEEKKIFEPVENRWHILDLSKN